MITSKRLTQTGPAYEYRYPDIGLAASGITRVAGKTSACVATAAKSGDAIEALRSAARPLIAVTTSEIRLQHPTVREGEPPQEEMVLGISYLRAIEAAGGIPVVVPPLETEAAEPLLERVSGVCLTGGPDLDPTAYAARSHEQLGPTWSELDAFELALARAADARRLPILAICRGLQVLNVARGGTLHQHLPDVVGRSVNHRQREPASEPTHWVTLDGASRVSEILGRRRVKVNSCHHQAVAELGQLLNITGRASDGTVECLEALDREFVVGVQWHAECLRERGVHSTLFAAFVHASRRFEQATTRLVLAA
jgi:putative glutamine amidotransferase